MEHCKYCGEPMTDRTKFCPNCGRPREKAPVQAEVAPEEPTETEYIEAEFEVEEPEGSSAQQSPKVDHVLVTDEPSKAQTEAPKAQPETTNTQRETPKTRPEPKTEPRRPVQTEWKEPPPMNTEPPRRATPTKKKASKLSIWAFICSLSLIASGLGIILAIVDLAKKDKEHKHGLSKAALVIGGILCLLVFIGRNYAMPKLLAETSSSAGSAPTPIPTMKMPGAKVTLTPIQTAAPAQTVRPASTSAGVSTDPSGKTAAKQSASTRVVSIRYGNGMLAGLRENGTVALTGFKSRDYHMDVSSWNNVVAIESNYLGDYLIGLKGDGTVVATGEIRAKAMQEMSSWRNIVYLEAADSYGYVLGVRTDGTVVGANVSREPASYESLLEKVGQWTDIASVKIFASDVYGRKKDGTWVTTEGSYRGLWTRRFEDAAEFYGSTAGDVVRYPDGRLKVRSNDMSFDISGWRGIQKLYVSSDYAIGLQQDGTILYTCSERWAGYHPDLTATLRIWKDIVDFDNDGGTVVGLKRDGTLAFAGNEFQFNEKEWTQAQKVASAATPRLTPAPMRTRKADESAAKKAAVEQLNTWETSESGKRVGYPNNSRKDYAVSLGLKGYSEDVIWYALEHCNIDWRVHAVRYAQKRVETPSVGTGSRIRLEATLLRELFTEEEIAYAETHWNINFKENAIARAQSYIKSSKEPWTKEKMIEQLEYEAFTHEEAVYAANKVGLK